MDAQNAGVGIYASGDLTLDGDVDVRARKTALYAAGALTADGDVEVAVPGGGETAENVEPVAQRGLLDDLVARVVDRIERVGRNRDREEEQRKGSLT